MKALVVNGLGGGFDLDDVQIATPMGQKFLSMYKRPSRRFTQPCRCHVVRIVSTDMETCR